MEENALIKELRLKVERLEKENLALKQEHQREINEVVKMIRKIIGILGLLDETGTTIKPEIVSGEESVFGRLLGSLNDIIGLITKSRMPIIGKRYEAQLEEQFAFVKDIVPLIQKYAK